MMKLKRSIFCSCLLFSQISCYSLNTNFQTEARRLPANIGPVGSLSGRVLNYSNTPIPDAIVTVKEDDRVVATVVTDQMGNYEVKELPSRDYSVNASAEGFKADTYMVRVIEGTNIEYTFNLPDV